MTYTFQGTPDVAMAAFFEAAEQVRASGSSAEWDQLHLLRTLVALLDRLEENPVAPDLLERFRVESSDVLVSLGGYVASYVQAASWLAEEARDGEWYELCIRRSSVQSLLEDYAGLPAADLVPRGDVVDLDLVMQKLGVEQGPVPSRHVPRGMPETHWWWRYPAATEDEAAGFYRPLDHLGETLALLGADTDAFRSGALGGEGFASSLGDTVRRLEAIREAIVFRSGEEGLDAFLDGELTLARRLHTLVSGDADRGALGRAQDEFAEHEPAGRASLAMGLLGARQARIAAAALSRGRTNARTRAQAQEASTLLKLSSGQLDADYHGPFGERFAAYLARHAQLLAA